MTVLKWAGGKRQLLPVILARLPSRYQAYHEPFVGGGAVFFELERQGSLPGPCYLSDANPRLITCYTALRDTPDAVIEGLEQLAHTRSPLDYYAARDRFNARPTPPPVELAALFLYLNRLCYNGLFRVNLQGVFNVPYGRYSPRRDLLRRTLLLQAAQALGRCHLHTQDFEEALEAVGRSDVVYLDPPYATLQSGRSFTAYHGSFGWPDQERLARALVRLDRCGRRFLLSNVYDEGVLELYRGFEQEVVGARRAINRSSTGRGKVQELLIRNYRG